MDNFAGLGGIAIGEPMTLEAAVSWLMNDSKYFNTYAVLGSDAAVAAQAAGLGYIPTYHSAHIENGQILNKPHYHPTINGQKKTHIAFLDYNLYKECEYREGAEVYPILLLFNMCYMLDIITNKEISKQEIKDYSKNCSISIYDKTSNMIKAESGKFYYSISEWGCACGFYDKHPSNGTQLINLLKDCLEYGEVVLFFYWGKEEYHLYENDINSYIKKVKNVRICFKEFLDVFMTQKFDVDDVVYIIEKNVAHDV